MLDLKLPFFGKRGTIKHIKEDKKIYIVSRYGLSDKQIIPKKEKNLQGLIHNYHEDVKKYLETSYDKYSEYKNIINDRKKSKKYKGNIDAKKVKLAILVTFIATIASATSLMALLPGTSLIIYLNMSFLALSLVSLSATSNVYANYKKDNKKDKFISEYKKYQKEVNEYNIKYNNNKNIPTRYKGLTEGAKENTLHKTRIKKREDLKNVS